ncbi:MAG: SCO family protein [Bacteroidota bacterium]|nr:SCO family protein [Bacteroidota bacterium]
MKRHHIVPLVALLLLTACQSEETRNRVTELPEIKHVPEFKFTNYNGSSLTAEDLEGKVYIAYFFFTSCGGPCPVMNSKANVLQAEYADAADFRIVGFSVDPERDDLKRLTRYAERYNAVQGRWYMLRNEKSVVADLASRGFMMGDASVPAMHSTRFALVDRNGIIRGYYDGMDDTKVDELRAALDFLLGRDA